MDLIGREHPTSDDKPPWAGMVFKQKVYSDAMLELLKRRYPQGANLRERKHMAAIEFLQQELREMQAEEAALGSQTYPNVLVTDVVLHGRKHQGSISPPPSPTTSYQPPAVTDDNYHGMKVVNAMSLKRPSAASNTSPGQEIVFSVADGPIAQRQKRKKMSTTEKIAYKQMRKIGACDSCKRQKAKCTHASGVTNGLGDSQAAGSMPKRDGALHVDTAPKPDTTNEQNAQMQALEHSREPLQQRNAPFQIPSIITPATTPESPQWCQDTRESAQLELSGTRWSASPDNGEGSSPMGSSVAAAATAEHRATTPSAAEMP
ncbi:hypothetical protein ACJQWK_09193 [Exserohilum turcicum]